MFFFSFRWFVFFLPAYGMHESSTYPLRCSREKDTLPDKSANNAKAWERGAMVYLSVLIVFMLLPLVVL